MGRSLGRAAAALVLWLLLLPATVPGAVAQESRVQGEWIGSFGCEGALTYIRMSVGADRVALHAFNETVLYEIGSMTAEGFEAGRIEPVKPPATPFPAAIMARLSVPEDLLTGTLDGWGSAARNCTHFVMVRIVKWPKPDNKKGVLMVPTSQL